jgi:hypothetical protein
LGAGPPPSDAEVRDRLKSDRAAAVRTLEEFGIRRLATRGSSSFRFRPLVAGDLRARVTAGRVLIASARKTFTAAGSYRVVLRATRAGRRHLRANPATRWRLKLGFARSG